MPAGDDWLQRIASVRRWSRRGERAPHKPLLLLYALGRLQRCGTSEVSYVEAEPELARLLRDYGPPRTTSPAYPFHHLQSDGLWVVHAGADRPGSSPTRLRSTAATGRLVPEFEAALRADSRLVAVAVRSVLEANFPDSLHRDLCEAVGIDVEALEVAAAKARAHRLRRRDAKFREQVLVAYEYRCAMCGYDGRLGSEAVGLDAAHVRWWAFDGPDAVDNGLCLCSFHHKLLDRGVLGVTEEHAIAVSSHFIGRGRAAEELVLRLVGQPLVEPQRGQPVPAVHHINWHSDQVFRQPGRVPA
ncbi:MAG: HNH endonuclease [Actinobacteria bacterium]|nr:HNH endonuclease [Actinomycetota bacterium]